MLTVNGNSTKALRNIWFIQGVRVEGFLEYVKTIYMSECAKIYINITFNLKKCDCHLALTREKQNQKIIVN